MISYWEFLLHPLFSNAGGRPFRLPVRIEPSWNQHVGRRLRLARLLDCPRVDRRTHNWRHYRDGVGSNKYRPTKSVVSDPGCRCISQQDMAKRLKITQGTLSKIEEGKLRPHRIDLSILRDTFGGDRTFWIVTGQQLDRGEKRKTQQYPARGAQ